MITLFPTDTVYGLAVDATNVEAIQALHDLKGREEGKYFPIIVADVDMARHYAVITPLAEKLIERFWPGKLTLVLEAKNLPKELLAPDGTIGIRVPNHLIARNLSQELGVPITGTSANVSGMPTLAAPKDILVQFGAKAVEITRVIDVGELPVSEPSTVVDARGDMPIVIRVGAISEAEIFSA